MTAVFPVHSPAPPEADCHIAGSPSCKVRKWMGCIGRAPGVWSGMWGRNWWWPCEKWLFYLLRFSNETWCRPNWFCGWVLIRAAPLLMYERWRWLWMLFTFVVAWAWFRWVNEQRRTHQLQNSEFCAFIYAHNCVEDWRKFDDAYPCPGRALRRRWSSDVVEPVPLNWRGGGKSKDGDSSRRKIARMVHWFLLATTWGTDADSTMYTPAQTVPCAEDDQLMLLNLPL